MLQSTFFTLDCNFQILRIAIYKIQLFNKTGDFFAKRKHPQYK